MPSVVAVRLVFRGWGWLMVVVVRVVVVGGLGWRVGWFFAELPLVMVHLFELSVGLIKLDQSLLKMSSRSKNS